MPSRVTIAGLICIAVITLGTVLGVAATAPEESQAPAPTKTYDPFLPENFPCSEDDVLGYDPSFGPNRVGCIHVEGDTLERP